MEILLAMEVPPEVEVLWPREVPPVMEVLLVRRVLLEMVALPIRKVLLEMVMDILVGRWVHDGDVRNQGQSSGLPDVESPRLWVASTTF